jgi:fatty acid desaturase
MQPPVCAAPDLGDAARLAVRRRSVDTIKAPVSYRSLRDQVSEAGLLDRRPAYYTGRIACTLGAYVAGWVAVVMVGNSWLTLLCAAALAVLFAQVVFVGHDAGHNQISSSRRTNRLLGLLAGNLLCGVGFGWWVPKHNAHHAHPNEPGFDPDLGTGILAFSFTPEAPRPTRGLGAVLARWQVWLFVPLLVLAGLGLHISSVEWVLKRRGRLAAVEGGLLLAHAAIYGIVIFTVLSPARAVAFLAVQQGLFGLYLGCSFAPNHKGMPLLNPDSTLPFATRQVISARNVTGGRVVDFLLGGLNHQIEHHLFPTMSRPNLARAVPLVRAFCADAGLPYCEMSLISSYRITLRQLSVVSKIEAE